MNFIFESFSVYRLLWEFEVQYHIWPHTQLHTVVPVLQFVYEHCIILYEVLNTGPCRAVNDRVGATLPVCRPHG